MQSSDSLTLILSFLPRYACQAFLFHIEGGFPAENQADVDNGRRLILACSKFLYINFKRFHQIMFLIFKYVSV